MKGKGGCEGERTRIKTQKKWFEEQGRQRDVRTESATENKSHLQLGSSHQPHGTVGCLFNSFWCENYFTALQ